MNKSKKKEGREREKEGKKTKKKEQWAYIMDVDSKLKKKKIALIDDTTQSRFPVYLLFSFSQFSHLRIVSQGGDFRHENRDDGIRANHLLQHIQLTNHI